MTDRWLPTQSYLRQLNRSVQAGATWEFHSNFPGWSEFSEGGKVWRKLHENPAHPPISLSVSKQRRISILESQNTVRVCFMLLGGGWWTFKNMFEALFPQLWKKTQGHFLTEEDSAWQISVDSKKLGKSLRNCHIRPTCTDPFNSGWHEY